jgi:hypothetical protein
MPIPRGVAADFLAIHSALLMLSLPLQQIQVAQSNRRAHCSRKRRVEIKIIFRSPGKDDAAKLLVASFKKQGHVSLECELLPVQAQD